MSTNLRNPDFSGQKTLITQASESERSVKKKTKSSLTILVILSVLMAGLPILEPGSQKAGADLAQSPEMETGLVISQNNTLVPIISPFNPEPPATQKIRVVVTAYSSTVDQTDSSPFITAAGTWVREGIVASNFFPFGTKIRLPEIYGDKIFVVEDRMHWRKGNYHIDIWFSSHWEAKNFGAKRTYIEILEG